MSDARGPQTGDKCPRETCDGALKVLNSVVGERFRTQYFGCDTCGCRPQKNIRIIPIQYAPPRRRA